ncbi:hypothetical protein AMTRI_Chr13g121660 [Amborella trichopoda]|uniref:Uncharacterized protein n=1 Tax=Amborella trichopoda TaxID=13333 RepID=W1NP99_AMBTC|nr:hypothetical protein AMTR_s00200p00024680 [Amborella trichopoda]
MALLSLLVRSLCRFVASFISRPVASVTTILYYSDLLPRNTSLMRMVQNDLLENENYLFNFLINLLSCFW